MGKEKTVKRLNPFTDFGTMSDYYALSNDERLKYDQSLKAYRYMTNQYDYAISEGRARGIAEGIIEGKENEKKATILRMHAKNMPIETIADNTQIYKAMYFNV